MASPANNLRAMLASCAAAQPGPHQVSAANAMNAAAAADAANATNAAEAAAAANAVNAYEGRSCGQGSQLR
jgi:hypothetical protein